MSTLGDSKNNKPQWQKDLKKSFKQFKKTMSKENIKQKLSRKPSAELGAGKENSSLQQQGESKKDLGAPPIMPLQTALKNRGAYQQTPEPKSIPKSPLAAMQEMQKTTFSTPSPVKGQASTPSKSPGLNLAGKIEEKQAEKPTDDDSGASRNQQLIKCSRILGGAVLLFFLKSKIGFGTNRR